MMYLLEVRGLSRYFGGVKAIDDVSFHIGSKTILSIIGPNGAGKTTLFNCLTGFLKPTRGSIIFSGRDISGYSADRINRLGISRTFQNIRLFRKMTVLENVLVAQHHQLRSGLFHSIIKSNRFKAEEREARERCYEYLELLGLEAYKDQPSDSLPYGAQRRLEIARALATDAVLLLLDEPTAGMNPQETDEMMQTIQKLKGLDKTIILIEHDMRFVMGISERIIVLDHGVKIAEGAPSDIKNNPLVIEAYLGKEIH